MSSYFLNCCNIYNILNLLNEWGDRMNKAQTIQWLRNYINAEKAYKAKRDYRYKCAEELKQCTQKPKLESEFGIIGVIFGIIFKTALGAIVVGFICAVIWCIFMAHEKYFYHLFKTP